MRSRRRIIMNQLSDKEQMELGEFVNHMIDLAIRQSHETRCLQHGHELVDARRASDGEKYKKCNWCGHVIPRVKL